MLNKRFIKDLPAADALYEAQKIAFAPAVFQCVWIAWKTGLLERIDEASDGCSVEDLSSDPALSPYAVSVVMESCLSAGVVSLESGRYVMEKIGHFILHDRMTQVNMDFMHDVCFRGLADLLNSLQAKAPLGLATLGPWSSLYEGMTVMPEPAQTSWFDFDHYYSDAAVETVLPLVLSDRPRQLLEIGANNGHFAAACLSAAPDLRISLVDLDAQLVMARDRLERAGLIDRTSLYPINLLDPTTSLPENQDIVWMSQVLSCFDLCHFDSILCRARSALATGGKLLIMDTFWDRQKYDAAAYCLINTSPYFAAIASGCSKMYRSDQYISAAHSAGLRLTDVRDEIGICHSLLTFVAD